MTSHHRHHRYHRNPADIADIDIEQGQSMDESPLQQNQAFGHRLAAVGLPEVFYHPSQNNDEYIINLPNLQRMMLHTFQRDLVHEVSSIRNSKTVSRDRETKIRTALSSYGVKPFRLRAALLTHENTQFLRSAIGN